MAWIGLDSPWEDRGNAACGQVPGGPGWQASRQRYGMYIHTVHTVASHRPSRQAGSTGGELSTNRSSNSAGKPALQPGPGSILARPSFRQRGFINTRWGAGFITNLSCKCLARFSGWVSTRSFTFDPPSRRRQRRRRRRIVALKPTTTSTLPSNVVSVPAPRGEKPAGRIRFSQRFHTP
jgi:hypothetical protein